MVIHTIVESAAAPLYTNKWTWQFQRR